MSQKLILWVEDYLFYPNAFQKLISFLLLPLTFIYLLIISFKKMGVKKIDFGIPVISIGNLIVGGSGKTPFVIERGFYDLDESDIEIPIEYSIESLPKNIELKNEFGYYKCQMKYQNH